jgi:glycosyltransferase involved in cell wall biosynthesis
VPRAYAPGTVACLREPALVSVVIPAHNAAPTIGQQLAALAEQDYSGGWEVVVTDNGSTDGTTEVARQWSHRVPGLEVVEASGRRGASHARNAGVAASSGDFLAFCDADDIVTSGWLTALVVAGGSSDMVSGRLDLERLNDVDVRAWMGWVSPTEALQAGFGFLPAAYGGNCGIWRRVLEHVGGWNEDYTGYEDVELSWRVQLAGYRLASAPSALISYRFRSHLRGLWRQGYREGRTEVRLFSQFARHGMPRTNTRRALRTWAGRVRHAPELLTGGSRGYYVRATAAHLARLVGSIRHRTLYL